MNAEQAHSAQHRRRTGWIMMMTYLHDPRPHPKACSFDDPVLQQASRDAILWLGINLLRGMDDEQAYANAYDTALHSARDALLRRSR